MALFFVYMLKSSVCLAVMFLFHRLLLSRETFHRFNRLALLSLLVISSLMPFVEFPVHEVAQMEVTFPIAVDTMETVSQPVVEPEQTPFPWRELLLLAYLVGVAVFLLSWLWSLVELWRLVRRCKPLRTEADGIRILTHTDPALSPFSWHRYIVLSEADLAENGRAILLHERAHIRALHSLDILVARLCVVLQWFNPAAWLLLHELQNIHEFEADESVLSGGVDAKTYQLLLIKKAVGTRLYSMANSLNDSSLNKRIIMMMRKNSSPWARAKYLYVLPLAAVSITALARTEVSNLESELSACKVSNLFAFTKAESEKSVEPLPIEQQKAPETPASLPKTEENDSIYNSPEVKADFPGGEVACIKFLADHIKYPEEAQKKKQEGRVYIYLVVNKDGSVTDTKVARTCGVPELDNEAIRVARLMPKWTPAKHKGETVRSRFLFPIFFRLNSGKATATTCKPQPRLKSSKKTIKLASVSASDSSEKATEDTVLLSGTFKTEKDTVYKSGSYMKAEKAYVLRIGDTTTLPEQIAQFDDKVDNGILSVTAKSARLIKNPLILVDGKEVSQEDYEAITADQIENIRLLKSPNLHERYGEKGKNGVMLITTKNASKKNKV